MKENCSPDLPICHKDPSDISLVNGKTDSSASKTDLYQDLETGRKSVGDNTLVLDFCETTSYPNSKYIASQKKLLSKSRRI